MNDRVILTFIKSGLHTSVQDGGRPDYRHLGVPAGGPMDRASANIANMLVENDPGTPVLEIALMGPEIDIQGDCQIAITGADISPEINGLSVPMYETLLVKRGSVLFFSELVSGCRAYLAVRGMWKAAEWLGSSSASACNWKTLTPDSFIKKRSQLVILTKPHIPKKIFPKADIPEFPGNISVSVIPGPEFETFPDALIRYFFSNSYRISAQSNRMGYRLDPPVPDFKPEKEIISSGIVPGTIQITGSGQAVVLMSDAQTTGGYPRLGNVITADLDRLGQLKPGDHIRFSLLQ